MYKGKFDQKNRGSSTDMQELLAQRNAAPKEPPLEELPKPKSAPVRQPKAEIPKQIKAEASKQAKAEAPKQAKAEAPRQSKAAPQKSAGAKAPQSAKQPAPQKPAKPPKRGPRLGGVIFYTLYFLFILVFFVATLAGLIWLRGWLVDFEASQPTVRAQQVFDQLFTDPQWGDLYDAAGVQDTPYEGKDAFVTYMEQKVGDAELTYLETSAGLSGGKKYVVRLDNENIAGFTLVDKNDTGATTLENLDTLPDWQLSSVEIYFERTNSYLIEKVNSHTVYVNDVALDDSHTIQIATTKASEYLPEGTAGVSTCIQQVTDLFATPTVTIFDEDGNQMEVSYDEATQTFTERTESNTISDEQRQVVIGAVQTSCLWMIEEITNRGTVAQYFDATSEAYTNIVNSGDLWVQDHGAYEFVDTQVTDFCQYSDELFSVRAGTTLNVTRTNGTVRAFEYLQSLFFHKNDSGKWVCFISTNVDITQPVGKVRLTFMQGDIQLMSDMYYTDATEIITPIVSTVPEGQVFSGWVTREKDENGSTVYNLVFQPDDSGRVTLPEGNTLTPMTLYALYEDAATAGSTTETAPAETAAETAPAATEGA